VIELSVVKTDKIRLAFSKNKADGNEMLVSWVVAY
jgi:hypothetical protein